VRPGAAAPKNGNRRGAGKSASSRRTDSNRRPTAYKTLPAKVECQRFPCKELHSAASQQSRNAAEFGPNPAGFVRVSSASVGPGGDPLSRVRCESDTATDTVSLPSRGKQQSKPKWGFDSPRPLPQSHAQPSLSAEDNPGPQEVRRGRRTAQAASAAEQMRRVCPSPWEARLASRSCRPPWPCPRPFARRRRIATVKVGSRREDVFCVDEGGLLPLPSSGLRCWYNAEILTRLVGYDGALISEYAAVEANGTDSLAEVRAHQAMLRRLVT
jgi:hypothetical protein